jgi:hypothetical protein
LSWCKRWFSRVCIGVSCTVHAMLNTAAPADGACVLPFSRLQLASDSVGTP